MRRDLAYITALLSLAFVTACNTTTSKEGPEIYENYIFFGQQFPTKAPLVTQATDIDKFGVIGFKYDYATTWEEYKTKSECTPNLFFGDDNAPVNIETLDCTSGTPTYTPLQGWSNTKKYTFFAFYPIDNANVKLISTEGGEYLGGTPAIEYSLNTADPKSSMVDLMAAAPQTDKYYLSATENNLNGSNEVKFTFDHLLSSIGVKLTKATANTVIINNISLKISGIKYRQYSVPLDGSDKTPKGPALDKTTLILSLPETGVEVSGESEGSEISDKLIFIPQSENVTINLTLNYTRSDATGASYTTDNITLGAVTTPLTAGQKHLVHLKFTDSTVEIESKVTEGAWNDIPDVENTFN